MVLLVYFYCWWEGRRGEEERCSRAMVLGNVQCFGALVILIILDPGPTEPALGVGGLFAYSFSLSLGDEVVGWCEAAR